MLLPNSWKTETIESHFQDIERVIGEMHTHLEEELTLEDLSDIALISPFHFNRVFRQITGVPPCRFLWMLRLEEAKRLLVTTRRSVIDICYQVGYGSLGTFTRRFTQLVGIAPLRFRHMASSQVVALMDATYDRVIGGSEQKAKCPELTGFLSAPEEFQGIILVGLFRTPVPYGRPVGCGIALAGRRYSIGPLPGGRFFLFVAGLCRTDDPLDLLLGDRIYRGTAEDGQVELYSGTESIERDVTLRGPQLTDPPFLPCLPALVQQSVIRSPTVRTTWRDLRQRGVS